MTIVTCLIISSCNDCSHCHKKRNRQIDCYRHTNDDGSFLYYYIIFSQNSGTYYSYQSTAVITNFSTVSWSTSTVDPTTTASFQSDYQSQPDVEVEASDLPESVEVDLEAGDPPTEGTEEASEGTEGSEGSEGDSGGDSGGDGGGGDGGGGE